MKKSKLTLTALAVAGVCTFSAPSYSALLLGAKVGMDYWYADAEINNIKADDASFQPSLYVSLEHFIPIVPNGKLRYTPVESSKRNISFDQFDFIGYYEILDTDLISVDVGLNIQHFTGTFRGVQFDEFQPNLYGDVRIGIPETPVSLFTTFSAGTFEETSTVDAEAGAIFTMNLALVDLNLKAGYRIQDYNFDYFKTLNPFGKQSFLNQGAFVGVEVNF